MRLQCCDLFTACALSLIDELFSAIEFVKSLLLYLDLQSISNILKHLSLNLFKGKFLKRHHLGFASEVLAILIWKEGCVNQERADFIKIKLIATKFEENRKHIY